MNIVELSVKRPVLATVVNALIVVLGIMALLRLPVRELPDVDTATISISTTYSGAAPEVIDTDITTVVEGAISGVEGVRSITSSSRLGQGRTVVEFVTGRDIDAAASDVRDAVARIADDLPDEADPPQIVKADSDSQPIMRIAITSDRMSPAEVTDFARRNLVERFGTLPGVANVEIFGERQPAIRIWLNRRAMAARGVTVTDVDAALRRNNVELPGGEIESKWRTLTVRTKSRLSQADEFARIMVLENQGVPVRLSDIARVEPGVEDDTSAVRNNGVPAIGLGILRQSTANTVTVAQAVRDELEAMKDSLPTGMQILVSSDDALFIRAAIHEVLLTLGIAVFLVVLVIRLFLASWRATLIPAITIPVSVIGTFIVIGALGYSINVLTLLALILAIGLVVDDAIVVLENVQRRIEMGERPRIAALRSAKEVGFAVVAVSLVLIAVFIPIGLMSGTVGRLFGEFGVVMAASVGFSTLTALTLCAALCAVLLKPGGEHPGRFGRAVERIMAAGAGGYRRSLSAAIGAPVLTLGIAACLGLLSLVLFQTLPQELTPPEDRGNVTIPITAPEGSNADWTDRTIRRIEAVLQPYRDDGTVGSIFTTSGFRGQPDRGFVVVRLNPWEQREMSQLALVDKISPIVSALPGARAFPSNQAGLGQRGGSSQPVQLVVGGPDYESVQQWAVALQKAAADIPQLQNMQLDYNPNTPELSVQLDRARADDLGISAETVGETLQTMLAGREITDYFDRGREYPVMVQADDIDRRSPSDLENIFIRNERGGLLPLAALVTLKETASAPELKRYGRLPAVTLSASLAPGADLGTALQKLTELAQRTLPPDARLNYAGQSRELKDSQGGAGVTFGLAILIVFLVMAGQFESFRQPLAIMFCVPLAVTGAFLSLLAVGMSLNVYTQIGLILLIGLTAKNGILLVDFANQQRAAGKPWREAIVEGSVLRFRPILMTVAAMILGAVPLVVTFGAGAEARRAIGVVIVGGLSLSTLLTLYVTPVLTWVLRPRREPSHADMRDGVVNAQAMPSGE